MNIPKLDTTRDHSSLSFLLPTEIQFAQPQTLGFRKGPAFSDLIRAPQEAVSILGLLSDTLSMMATQLKRQPLLPCLLVGGFPRNLMMGKPPGDVDLVVRDSYYEFFIQCLISTATKWDSTITWGKDHKLMNKSCQGLRLKSATVRFSNGYSWELDVREIKTSLEADSKARDFTCNAIYLDPKSLKIIDLLNGVQDLKAGILRPCNTLQTVFNHPSRWLRAFRFQRTMGLKMEKSTLDYLTKNLPSSARDCHRNSIRMEIQKILQQRQHRGAIIREMFEFGFLKTLLGVEGHQYEDWLLINQISSICSLFEKTSADLEGEEKDEFPDLTIEDSAKVILIGTVIKIIRTNPLSTSSTQLRHIKADILFETTKVAFFIKLAQLVAEYIEKPASKPLLEAVLPPKILRMLKLLPDTLTSA